MTTTINFHWSTLSQLPRVTLPAGVQAAYVIMSGKEYYLDDSTGEGIAECHGSVDLSADELELKHKRTDAALRKVFSSMAGDSSDEIRRSYYTAIDNLQALVDLLLIEDGKLPANRQDGDCLRNEYILAKQAVAALGPSRLGAVL